MTHEEQFLPGTLCCLHGSSHARRHGEDVAVRITHPGENSSGLRWYRRGKRCLVINYVKDVSHIFSPGTQWICVLLGHRVGWVFPTDLVRA